MDEAHPAAVEHLPAFITGPGQSDVLFIAVVILVLGIVLMYNTALPLDYV